MKVDGHRASIKDSSQYEEILGRFHRLGLIHGDVNRYNFIIGQSWVKIIDFKHYQETNNQE